MAAAELLSASKLHTRLDRGLRHHQRNAQSISPGGYAHNACKLIHGSGTITLGGLGLIVPCATKIASNNALPS